MVYIDGRRAVTVVVTEKSPCLRLAPRDRGRKPSGSLGLSITLSRRFVMSKKFPKPWFRPSRNVWYVTIDGVQHNLGSDESRAFEHYHRLMAESHSKGVPGKTGAGKVAAIPGGVCFAGICWDFDLLFRKRSGHDTYLNLPSYFSGNRICPVWISQPGRYDRSFVRMRCSSSSANVASVCLMRGPNRWTLRWPTRCCRPLRCSR